MTILDRARGARMIRIDTNQFADELARRLPDTTDVDPVAWATGAAHDAAGTARDQLGRATDLARDLGRDLVKAGGDLRLDGRMDEIAQRIRAGGTPTALRALVARLERELPDTDRDRYDRAYARGWVRARSTYLVLGLAAGIGAGVVAAVLLDPKRGPARRERIAARTSSLTQGLTDKVGVTVKDVSERARGVAAERGLIKSATDEAVPSVVAEASETVESAAESLESAMGETADRVAETAETVVETAQPA